MGRWDLVEAAAQEMKQLNKSLSVKNNFAKMWQFSSSYLLFAYRAEEPAVTVVKPSK